jgi:MGT family glycosyltransferase
MYALFTSIPLVGHLNPLLRQAEELRCRGWRVAIASTSEARAHIRSESPEIAFIDLGSLGPIADQLRRDQEAASRDPRFIRGTMRIVRGLNAVWPVMFDGLVPALAADRPDVMVVDLFSSAGLCAAEAAGIPAVVNNAGLLATLPVRLLPPADDLPFLFSSRSIREVPRAQRLVAPFVRQLASVIADRTVGRDLNTLRRSRNLPDTTIDDLLRDRHILVCGAFGLEYPRPLPPSVAMVGPMLPRDVRPLPPELEAWLNDGPVVYANLGTLAVASPGHLARMADAFSSPDFRVLWILNEAQADTAPGPLPSNVRVLHWGPPPFAVLRHPNVGVFVSHCGINSVHESLSAGTPIVGIPMFADQRAMAVRVADAGVGLWLDKRRFTADALRAAIGRVFRESSFRACIRAAQAAFVNAGGVSRAADLIERAIGAPTREAAGATAEMALIRGSL